MQSSWLMGKRGAVLCAGTLLAVAPPACSGSSHGAPHGSGGGDAPFTDEGGGASYADAGGETLDDRAARRAACAFGAGALSSETLSADVPVGAAIPIENIVVVMMENHSFDSYFGHLNRYANRTDVESAADATTNPDPLGQPQSFAHAAHLCVLDTNHEWAGTHQEIDNGKMDGFVTANDGWNQALLPMAKDASLWSGARAMSWYDERDIPFYYKLASTFAIADHYHASVPGPTYPNRMFLLAATSFGQTTNTVPDVTAFSGRDVTVLDALETAHATWKLYTDGLPGAAIVYGNSGLSRWGHPVTASFKQFQAEALSGDLPQVSFVDPNLLSEVNAGANTDEHPPGDIQSGERFVSDVVHAVMAGRQWSHLALFITHDEHGGFYDHVAPPRACPPDDTAPILAGGDTTVGGFDMVGVRVMLLAVSPYAKRSYVGHHVYDHTSVTRFIEAKFNLPALTARDANAEPPMDLFDFANPAFVTPPTLDAPTVDPAGLGYCTATFGQ